MISPTIGRVVWVRNRGHSSQPEAALVTYVHSDRLINVGGFDANGEPFRATSLALVQEGDEVPSWPYAEWMPFQKGQAAKTEQLERRIDEALGSDFVKALKP